METHQQVEDVCVDMLDKGVPLLCGSVNTQSNVIFVSRAGREHHLVPERAPG